MAGYRPTTAVTENRDLEFDSWAQGGAKKPELAKVLCGNSKDNTSKDPFSRCEICKNLGYRLS